MAKKRNLDGVPVYETQGPDVEDDEILDAEVVEDGPTLSDRARSARRRLRAQGMRDTFVSAPRDAMARGLGIETERMRYRDRQRERRNERYDAKWAETQARKAEEARIADLRQRALTDPEAQLQVGIMDAGKQFSDAVRSSDLLEPGQTQETQKKQLTGMHQVYASMMVLQCVEPLRRGLGGANVLSALGMGAAMWTMSPNFRTQIGDFAGSIGKAINDKIESSANKKGEKAIAKRDKAADKGTEDRLLYRAKYKLLWKKRIERMERMERGDRDPFTAESAALAEVALGEAAYAAMRTEGNDPQQVKDSYEGALSQLYGMVDHDGIPREDVSRAARTIIGRRMASDPGYASAFTGLAHGMYDRSDPVEQDGRRVWAGDFENPMTGKVAKGSFRARPPMDPTDHRVQLRDAIYSEMGSSGTIEELDASLTQMMVAASADVYRGLPEEASDPVMRRRFAKARTAFDSMAADGLSEEQRAFVYTAAYQDAVDALQRANPELGDQWRERFGETWRDNVADEMDRVREMGRKAGRNADMDAERGRPRGWDESGAYADPYESEDEGDIVEAEIVEDDFEFEGDAYVTHDFETGTFVSAVRTPEDTARTGKTSSSRSSEIALRGAARKNQRARVNQHYNQVETGGITGFGRDDAQPLQDPDFELGG